ncbi:uncharacterized protein LOC106670677 isoform X2 [Cimex lectularius]|uniref:Uncharacterized protein n=1 Tax=Cimex lectularius TaxID=79782 RepID=A0A8I6S5U0_CIMLE|nr:uncharacterized protein LOC106670677 isoform X2 [Cimex lectularius]
MRLSKLKEWAYTPSSIMESNDNVDTGRYEFLKQVNWYSNPVVKVSNWEYPLLSLPYDNITQNQKISQYNRLGFSNEDNLISVSREAQMQVFENTVKQPKHKYCPMLNLITYPTTMSARREEIRRLNNLICDNLCTNLVDYRSTTHTDYPTPYPFIGRVSEGREEIWKNDYASMYSNSETRI